MNFAAACAARLLVAQGQGAPAATEGSARTH
jgi:hypothetical protein